MFHGIDPDLGVKSASKRWRARIEQACISGAGLPVKRTWWYFGRKPDVDTYMLGVRTARDLAETVDWNSNSFVSAYRKLIHLSGGARQGLDLSLQWLIEELEQCKVDVERAKARFDFEQRFRNV